MKAHLVFLDESGFMLIPSLRRTWAPRGQTPLLHHRLAHDRISAISAVTVGPQRQRLGLYCHLHFFNIRHTEVAEFLRQMLRTLRGTVIVVWDGRGIHRGPALSELLQGNPRLHIERFPAYAPELNPDEQVWNHWKAHLANGSPASVEALAGQLCSLFRRTRRWPTLLRSFIRGSDLLPFL